MAENLSMWGQSILDQMKTAGEPKTTTTEYPTQPVDMSQIALLLAMFLSNSKNPGAAAANEANTMNNAMASGGSPISGIQGKMPTDPSLAGIGGWGSGQLTPDQIQQLFQG